MLENDHRPTLLNSSTPDLAVIGYSTIDINVTASATEIHPGGAAFFAALAASLIHQPVGLISIIGQDYLPSKLLHRLDTAGLQIHPFLPTARSTQTYFDKDDPTNRHIAIEWGAAALLEGKHIPEAWLSILKVIHVATMIPTQQFAIIDFIRRHAPQAKISVDTDQFLLKDRTHRSLIIRNFEAADIGFANRHEYQILGRTLETMPEAVIKLDADGAFYLNQGRVEAKSVAKPVTAIDVTGAGDLFAGAFLAQQLKTQDPQVSLITATNLATQSVTKKGIEHLFSEGAP